MTILTRLVRFGRSLWGHKATFYPCSLGWAVVAQHFVSRIIDVVEQVENMLFDQPKKPLSYGAQRRPSGN